MAGKKKNGDSAKKSNTGTGSTGGAKPKKQSKDERAKRFTDDDNSWRDTWKPM
jgi:hypothetical protein